MSRPSTSNSTKKPHIQQRLNSVLSSPSFSKAGRSMRRLMQSAPSGDQGGGGSSRRRATSSRNALNRSSRDSDSANQQGDSSANNQQLSNSSAAADQSQQQYCVESQFKLYIPKRLDASSSSRNAASSGENDALGYSRRDDAMISSPRSVDSIGFDTGGATAEDSDDDYQATTKKPTSSGVTRAQQREANERRQTQFLEKTDVGRRLLQSYKKDADGSSRGSSANGGIVPFDDYSPTDEDSKSSGDMLKKRSAAASNGSFYFKYTGRKDPARSSDAPPTGRYNPRFHLVEQRVSGVSMAKSFNPRTRPMTSPALTSARSNSMRQSTSLMTPRKSPKMTPRRSTGKKKRTPSSNKKKSSPKGATQPMAPGTSNPEKSTPHLAGALRGFGGADDESISSDDTETRRKKKQMKRYQDQVDQWIESRFHRPPAKGLSSMRSSTAQRGNGGIPKMHDLSYWPKSDSTRHMGSTSKTISDMGRETGRETHMPGKKPSVHDAVYYPNHDIRYTRTTLGQHDMNGHCDRDSQMRTTRVAVKNPTGKPRSRDIASDKFYDTDKARAKNVYRREEPHINMKTRIGRNDPRDNYLLSTIQKARNTKGTVLGGLEPDHLLSTRSRPAKDISFSKQIGRKFNPGFVMNDLSYDVDMSPVNPNSPNLSFDKNKGREFNPGFILHDLMYESKLESSTRVKRSPAPVDMKRDTSRATNKNAMLQRTGGQGGNDVEYEKASHQQLSLQDRTKGDPFIRKQLGRSELERLSKRQRAAPDVFYTVQPSVLDQTQKREIRFSSVDMDKVTNRYEKFESSGSMVRGGGMSNAQGARSGGKGDNQPFVVRGTAGVNLNDLTYDPQYSAVEERAITHTIC